MAHDSLSGRPAIHVVASAAIAIFALGQLPGAHLSETFILCAPEEEPAVADIAEAIAPAAAMVPAPTIIDASAPLVASGHLGVVAGPVPPIPPSDTLVALDPPTGFGDVEALDLKDFDNGTREPLAVRVVDDRGYPVASARITGRSKPTGPRIAAMTNRDGETNLTGARGLAVELIARARGFAPVTVFEDGSSSELKIVMQPGSTVEGAVHDRYSGDPLGGAEVTLSTKVGELRARTDRRGNYSFDDLARGGGRIRVKAHGYADVQIDVAIAEPRVQPQELPRIEMALRESMR